MTTTLKDGSEVEDPRLDRLYEEDWDSLNYLVRNVPANAPLSLPIKLHKPRSYTYRCDLWLDQGQEGACVSTGCGHELAAYPVEVFGINFQWCWENIYHPAQHDDPWAGCTLGPRCPIQPSSDQYEGTAVLAGLKQLKRMGFILSYVWALTLEEAVLGLGYHGPGIFGCNWYPGMYDTDVNGYIHPTGSVVGGHCLLVHSVKIHYKRLTWGGWFRREWKDVDLDRSYVIVHNSWGKSWGENGRAKLSLRDLGKLLDEQGEFAFVERNPEKRNI